LVGDGWGVLVGGRVFVGRGVDVGAGVEVAGRSRSAGSLPSRRSSARDGEATAVGVVVATLIEGASTVGVGAREVPSCLNRRHCSQSV
jgi:hypothetical protein